MKYYSILNYDKSYVSKYGEIASGLIIEKKSKFYSYIFKITEENDATDAIEKIRNDHKEVRHIVYIYSLLQNNVCNIRFSDDGEPKGTGTKAIYELLTKEAITNICIVIVRYFGGILLGAGPLSRTYLNTARKALDMCEKKEIFEYLPYHMFLSYTKYQVLKAKLDYYITTEDIQIKKIDFSHEVTLEIAIKKEKYQDIVENVLNM